MFIECKDFHVSVILNARVSLCSLADLKGEQLSIIIVANLQRYLSIIPLHCCCYRSLVYSLTRDCVVLNHALCC